MGTQGSQHSENSAKLQSSLFLFQTSHTIARSCLVRLGLISTSAKSTQNMKENLSFNLKMKLSCKQRLVKVMYGHGGRVSGAVPHVSMSAIATSIHWVGSTINSLLCAGLLCQPVLLWINPASALEKTAELCNGLSNQLQHPRALGCVPWVFQ